MKQNRFGVTFKTSVFNGCIVFILLLIAATIIFRFQSNLIDFITKEYNQKLESALNAQVEREKTAFMEDLKINMQIAGGMSGLFLFEFDNEGLQAALAPYGRMSNIVGIRVIEKEKNPFVAIWKQEGDVHRGTLFPEDLSIESHPFVESPIVHNDQTIGRIQFYYSEEQFLNVLKNSKKKAMTDFCSFIGVVNQKTKKAFINQVIVTCLIVLILVCSINFSLRFTAIRPIREIVKILFTKANQFERESELISNATQMLADGASEQAASIQEITGALEELSGKTRENAASATDISLFIQQVDQEAERADKGMKLLVKAVKRIENASRETSEIIRTVEDISFQTNLLSLNASVEAARAGEAGAGFSVVAGEIRRLSEKSAEAAKRTDVLIENTISSVGQCSELSFNTNEILERLVNNAQKVRGRMTQMSAASQDQAHHIEQINLAIAATDDVIQSSAVSTQEAASSSAVMHHQAEEMKEAVGVLESVISGSQKRKRKSASHAHNKALPHSSKAEPL